MGVKKGIIIGLGEVGSSWFKILSENGGFDVTGIDIKGNREKKADKKEEGKSALHVCIPFFDGGKFEEIVSEQIRRYNPNLVIVNTSCRVGSTRNLYNLTKVPMVHIPVRGIHPNIDKGIRTFENAIGPIDGLSGKLAEDYLDFLGIGHETFNNPEETEMAKILDTSYYGWNILFAKQVFELCEELGLDFYNVYTSFNKSYNEGYEKLGKPNVRRPVLTPPQIFNREIGISDNKINGHCVRTNLEILKTMKMPKSVTFVDYAIEMDEQ
jgi:UDP-N-acetyl-D-mannosaminuronate dehydrogenase